MDLVSIWEVDATSLYVNRLCPETLLAVLVFMNFPFYKNKKKQKKKKFTCPVLSSYIFSQLLFSYLLLSQENKAKEIRKRSR